MQIVLKLQSETVDNDELDAVFVPRNLKKLRALPTQARKSDGFITWIFRNGRRFGNLNSDACDKEINYPISGIKQSCVT